MSEEKDMNEQFEFAPIKPSEFETPKEILQRLNVATATIGRLYGQLSDKEVTIKMLWQVIDKLILGLR